MLPPRQTLHRHERPRPQPPLPLLHLPHPPTLRHRRTRPRPPPRPELDTAALNGILTLYDNRDLFDRVAADAASRRQTDRAQHECELKIVDADIDKADQAIKRYLLAFEAGTLSETLTLTRVRFAANCHTAYRKASHTAKRQLNNAIFARITLRDGHIDQWEFHAPLRRALQSDSV
jgi:hypothetical protein